MAGAVLMVQGTASSAGKSLTVAGLCRLFADEGYRVAPFKSQNMSNNAAVTDEGHEIGRAQAMQAFAARQAPHVDMNPILLKPEADHRSQVVVMGRALDTVPAAAYQSMKDVLWGEVTAALGRLRAANDLVIIEGAGSPAEINLKARDIANMRVALHANAPVLLVGDIDRGGVFAHLYGTCELLDPPEKALVKGLIINKLRGDPALLEPGLTMIEGLTGVPVAGVVPWVRGLNLPEEDSVALDRRSDERGPSPGLVVAVVRLPRIANFDDFDPLEAEDDVSVRYIDGASGIEHADLVILPGTKATIADLAWLRERGLAEGIARAAAAGVPALGICGGFQMLGREIRDPLGVESHDAEAAGIGLLEAGTVFHREKHTFQTTGRVAGSAGLLAGMEDMAVRGYEIHAGVSHAAGVAFESGDGRVLGASSANGMVVGCYLHGLFANQAFRHAFLSNLARLRRKRYAPSARLDHEASLDRLADVLRSSLDLPLIHGLVEGQR